MPFDLANSLASLEEDRKAEVMQRLELVHAAQRRMGMEPRNDSQLTWNYAIGKLDEEDAPSTIANELFVVDNIFRTTNYSSIVEDVMREVAHHMKQKYRLTWTDAWEMTRFYAPTMLKLYCMKEAPQLTRTSTRHVDDSDTSVV